jgi:hypothetical protein
MYGWCGKLESWEKPVKRSLRRRKKEFRQHPDSVKSLLY